MAPQYNSYYLFCGENGFIAIFSQERDGGEGVDGAEGGGVERRGGGFYYIAIS